MACGDPRCCPRDCALQQSGEPGGTGWRAVFRAAALVAFALQQFGEPGGAGGARFPALLPSSCRSAVIWRTVGGSPLCIAAAHHAEAHDDEPGQFQQGGSDAQGGAAPWLSQSG